MTAVRFVLVIALVALTARSQQNSPQEPSAQPQPVPPASCPITRRPAKEFIAPVPYKRDENSFWLGTEKLWTFLPERAIWEWAPHQPGRELEVQPLTAKIFWMRLGYDSRAEERPAIKVTGRRLDGPAPSLLVLPPTNAFQGPGSAMLTGVYVPTPELSQLRDPYIKADTETIRKSLEGNWRPEHLFTLGQSRNLYRIYLQQIVNCDLEIEKMLEGFAPRIDPEERPLPPDRKRNRSGSKRRRKNGHPGNIDSLGVFRNRLLGHWWQTLRRRSQQRPISWKRTLALAARWLPKPRILHPYPAHRFAAGPPR